MKIEDYELILEFIEKAWFIIFIVSVGFIAGAVAGVLLGIPSTYAFRFVMYLSIQLTFCWVVLAVMGAVVIQLEERCYN